MATPPHYCLFALEKEVGSVHDYQNLKSKYHPIAEYLLKTPEEMHHLQGDLRSRFWAAVLDRGYVGPAEDTPDLRRITPKKGRGLTEQQILHNTEIDRFRCPVEQYFGRMLQSWAVPRGKYRWDHNHFQIDFENWCLLTNELIQVSFHLRIYFYFTPHIIKKYFYL